MLTATLLVLVFIGQVPESSSDPAALIEKLGSARYAERTATQALESLGSKALPALRSALKSKDPEIRSRAKALIHKIEGNALTQETPIRLDYSDLTVGEIVKSISKQAGFPVTVGSSNPDDPTVRATIREEKPVPFWKAIDRVCEAAHLVAGLQNNMVPGQSSSEPSVVLFYQRDFSRRPKSDHGPFRVSVNMIHYQSQVSFHQPVPPFGAFRGPMLRSIKGVPNKDDRRPDGPPQAGKRNTARTGGEGTANDRARIIQFTVTLQVDPEPRMRLSSAGPIELSEAVDELGNSLVPAARNENASYPVMGMGFTGGTGFGATAFAQLARPEKAGKLIKKLRGTVAVRVAARRGNLLVIPMEGSTGKTFQNDDLKVVVNSIENDPMTGQETVALSIENVEELFPEDQANSVGMLPRNRMLTTMANMGVGPDAQAPIQIVDSNGRNAIFQTTIDWDSGRVTLRILNIHQLAAAREIRISGVIRSGAKIPFEFTDLPMP